MDKKLTPHQQWQEINVRLKSLENALDHLLTQVRKFQEFHKTFYEMNNQ